MHGIKGENQWLDKRVSKRPLIYELKSFLDIKSCAHIVNVAKDKMKLALVSGEKEGVLHSARTNRSCFIPHRYDEIFEKISFTISKLLNRDLSTAEDFQIIHYTKDQEYKPHFDAFSMDGSELSRTNTKFGGQRIITALCYLNNVEKGGSTIFPAIPLAIKPERGKLILFKNTIDGKNTRDTKALHGGSPVIKGQKWASNIWFREQDRRAFYNYKITED